jgi:hypothetical protein
MSEVHSTKACVRCGEPAMKVRNKTAFCIPHYRMKQMIDDAKIDNKAAPTWEALSQLFDALIASGFRCPICDRPLNWLKKDGISTIVTLQHDRSGELRLLCLGCNVRHQFHPGDSFYDLPAGHKRCPMCKTVKPFAEFYPHKNQPNNRSSQCRPCGRADSLERLRKKRHARIQAM